MFAGAGAGVGAVSDNVLAAEVAVVVDDNMATGGGLRGRRVVDGNNPGTVASGGEGETVIGTLGSTAGSAGALDGISVVVKIAGMHGVVVGAAAVVGEACCF